MARARRLLDSRSKIDEDRTEQLEAQLKNMTLTADDMGAKYEEVGIVKKDNDKLDDKLDDKFKDYLVDKLLAVDVE